MIILSVFLLFINACSDPQKSFDSSISDVADRSKTLYLAHSLPTAHPVHKGLVFFQQRLAERSDGKLNLKIFPDGQLGSEREVVELLQIGSIAMTKVSAAVMANFAPEYKVLGVPYLFRDREHLFKVLEGETGRRILLGGSDFMLRGICFYDAGSRSFYTKNKAIRTPDDVKGLKIRVMNHKLSIDVVNAMGGSATPMAFSELYTALQQGVVDGAENNPPSVVSSNHYEICKYYTLDEHSHIPDVVLIGTRHWERLNQEERRWLQTAADESVIAQKAYWKESEEACYELLRSKGVEIIRPDKDLFAARAASILEDFCQDPDMNTLVQKIKNQ